VQTHSPRRQRQAGHAHDALASTLAHELQPDPKEELRVKHHRRAISALRIALAAVGASAVLAASAYAATASASATIGTGAGPHHHAGPASGQPVIDWNRVLLSIVNTPGAQPANIQPTRNFAILHAAIYDAVNAIDRTHQPYLISVRAPRHASATAAADAAAHTALVGLYPAEQSILNADYAAELATVPDGSGKQRGIRVGRKVATDILAIRAGDGSNALPPPFLPGSRPGDYRPTPPNFATPVFTNWGKVSPFVLERGNQFRPPPPPALTSPAYTAAFNEVKRLGSATSTTRTQGQTEIGTFWNAPIQNFWNQIAETVAIAHHSDLPTTARLFAALNLSLADSTIALYDAKYTYRLWRPVTAIRLAHGDGNPQTVADPTWLPLPMTTAADPSYPGAHSTISAAAAVVLASFYGNQQRFSVTSPALPGVTRSFSNFTAAAREAGLSRIYAGQHFRFDHTTGLTLGHHVAHFILRSALLPTHDSFGR
jgi:membrane-associated phospholipid phosphatase